MSHTDWEATVDILDKIVRVSCQIGLPSPPGTRMTQHKKFGGMFFLLLLMATIGCHCVEFFLSVKLKLCGLENVTITNR